MAVAQLVRMENYADRKVDEAFSEYERLYKTAQTMKASVTNTEIERERLTRTIERKQRELAELEAELDNNIERVANNLHPKREHKAIQNDIRDKLDEIDVKKRLIEKRQLSVDYKMYGELCPWGGMEYKLKKRAEFARTQPDCLIGAIHHAELARNKFFDLHYERKLKQFLQKFKKAGLVEQLQQLLIMKPNHLTELEQYLLDKASFAAPAGISSANPVEDVDNLGRALKTIFKEFTASGNIPASSPEDILKWFKPGNAT